MKAATITQPLASAAPAVDDQILRPLNPRTLTVDIVLPVLNEAHVLERSVTKLHIYLARNLPYKWRIIIADNGSTDGTAVIARWLAERYSEICLLQLPEKGRGRAIWIIDLSTNLDSFKPMITSLITGDAGLLTGSRLMKQSRTTRGFKREFISRYYEDWLMLLKQQQRILRACREYAKNMVSRVSVRWQRLAVYCLSRRYFICDI